MTSAQVSRYSDGLNSNGNHPAMTSISLGVAGLVTAPDLRARVESVFAEACNLVTDSGRRFSLVSGHIGDGPLNAVLGNYRTVCMLSPGDQVTGDGRWLLLGSCSGEDGCSIPPLPSQHTWNQQNVSYARSLRVDLQQARLWDPCPDYSRLALRPSIVMRHVSSLRHTLPIKAPPASLAARPGSSTQGAFGSRPTEVLVQARAGQLANGLLAAYRHCDMAGIRAHARQLAGLGPGLTPAGDDWLGGWLIGLRVQEAMAPNQKAGRPLAVAAVGHAVVEAAAGRTTGLSLAYLGAAARGAVPHAWRHFLSTLMDADPCPVQRAVEKIMRHGATSGSDTLAGFLASFVR